MSKGAVMAEQGGSSRRAFLKRLRAGTLVAPIDVVGMVRATDGGDDEVVEFSLDCARWIAIPIDMVDDIESVGVSPCKDHTHDTARIRLKQPRSDEATVFAQLLAEVSSAAAEPGISMRMIDPGFVRC